MHKNKGITFPPKVFFIMRVLERYSTEMNEMKNLTNMLESSERQTFLDRFIDMFGSVLENTMRI